MLTIVTALSVLAACNAARRRLSAPRKAEYCRGRLRLRPMRNTGAAFGLPIPEGALLPASAAALAALWAHRSRSPIGAGLILGGGLSNLAERLRHGGVCDYAQFPKAPGRLKNYVYNLADLAIFCGGAALLSARGQKKGRA